MPAPHWQRFEPSWRLWRHPKAVPCWCYAPRNRGFFVGRIAGKATEEVRLGFAPVRRSIRTSILRHPSPPDLAMPCEWGDRCKFCYGPLILRSRQPEAQ
jgi:hypothetical protein